MNRLTGGRAKIGALVFAKSGGTISGILTGTTTFQPGAMTTGVKVSTNMTITGVRAGDIVYLEAPVGIEAGCVVQAWRVTANDTVQVDTYNPTAGTVTPASRTWGYTVLRAS